MNSIEKVKETKETSRPWWKVLCAIFGYFCFIIYMFISVDGSYTWSKTLYYQQKDYSNLVSTIDEYRALGKIDNAMEYIKSQPNHLQDEITDIMIANAPKYEPVFYFEISSRLLQRYTLLDKETKAAEEYLNQAIFWGLLARFRIHVDAARCSPGETSVKVARQLSTLLTPGKIERFMQMPFEFKASYIEQVLVWDSKFPPQARPDFICRIIFGRQKGDMKVKTDVDSWGRVHQNVRLATIHGLMGYYKKAGIVENTEIPELMELRQPRINPVTAPISESEALSAIEEIENKAP